MNAKKVKLYSTHSCPFCMMEKQWLDMNHVEHEVVYVDENREEAIRMVQSTGQMGVPVTEVVSKDDKINYVIGFDQQNLKKLIGF